MGAASVVRVWMYGDKARSIAARTSSPSRALQHGSVSRAVDRERPCGVHARHENREVCANGNKHTSSFRMRNDVLSSLARVCTAKSSAHTQRSGRTHASTHTHDCKRNTCARTRTHANPQSFIHGRVRCAGEREREKKEKSTGGDRKEKRMKGEERQGSKTFPLLGGAANGASQVLKTGHSSDMVVALDPSALACSHCAQGFICRLVCNKRSQPTHVEPACCMRHRLIQAITISFAPKDSTTSRRKAQDAAQSRLL